MHILWYYFLIRYMYDSEEYMMYHLGEYEVRINH